MIILRDNKVINSLWIGVCRSCDSIIGQTEDELIKITNGCAQNGYRKFSREDCPVCSGEETILMYQKDSDLGRDLQIELNNEK